jgi:hypothetical protein
VSEEAGFNPGEGGEKFASQMSSAAIGRMIRI